MLAIQSAQAERSRGRWRLAMPWNPLDQKNQRSNHGESNDTIGGKGEDPGCVVAASAVRHHRGDHQNEDDCRQQPTRTNRKRFRQGPVNTGSSQHRYERGPPRFTCDWFAHDDVVKHAGGV